MLLGLREQLLGCGCLRIAGAPDSSSEPKNTSPSGVSGRLPDAPGAESSFLPSPPQGRAAQMPRSDPSFIAGETFPSLNTRVSQAGIPANTPAQPPALPASTHQDGPEEIGPPSFQKLSFL